MVTHPVILHSSAKILNLLTNLVGAASILQYYSYRMLEIEELMQECEKNLTNIEEKNEENETKKLLNLGYSYMN